MVIRYDISICLEYDSGAYALCLYRIVEPVTCNGLIRYTNDRRSYCLRRTHRWRIPSIRKRLICGALLYCHARRICVGIRGIAARASRKEDSAYNE